MEEKGGKISRGYRLKVSTRGLIKDLEQLTGQNADKEVNHLELIIILRNIKKETKC